MRAVIQCVSEASVRIDGQTVGEIGRGYAILLGVGKDDTEAQAEKLWSKILKLRVFPDENGKTNLSLTDIGGEVLVISSSRSSLPARKATGRRLWTRAPPTKPTDSTNTSPTLHDVTWRMWEPDASAQ